MNGSQFNEYIKHFPSIQNHFKGVFSIDLLPSKLEIKQFCIINSDVSSGFGKHWFALLRYDKNLYELFDSLGFNDHKIFDLKRHCQITEEIVYNKTQFQKNDTNTCGNFCVYFLIERLHNYDMDFDDLLENIFLTDNLDYNEQTVRQFGLDILNNFENGK